jgi:hypothetical protein
LRGKLRSNDPEAKCCASLDPFQQALFKSGNWVEGRMQDPLVRADHYRNEARKCHELAKHAQPAFLGDFYRLVAVRYMFMAEELLNEARTRSGLAREAPAPRRG